MKKRKESVKMKDNLSIIKSKLEEYVNEITKRSKNAGANMYICPLCGSGTPIADGKRHDGAFSIYGENKSSWKCHKCGRGGSIIDLYGYINGINANDDDGFKRIVQALEKKYNLSSNFSFPRVSAEEDFKDIVTYDWDGNVESHADDEQDEQRAYKEYEKKEIQLCIGACEHTIGFSDYLTKRGISLEIQKKFNIGYFGEWLHPKTKWKHMGNPHINEWVTPRIVIPTSDSSYLARATTPEPPQDDPKYKYYVKAYKVGGVKIFNTVALTNQEGYCFIVEGEIDALSCIECGFNAIGLGSTSNMGQIFNYHIDKKTVLIIAMDNDTAGAEAIPKLEELCKSNRQPYIIADSNILFDSLKDANALLQKDRPVLRQNLRFFRNKALNFDKSEYFKSLEAETLPNEKENTPLVVAHQEEPTPELPPYIRQKINEKTGEVTYTLNTEVLADVIRKQYGFILVKHANDRQGKPDFYLYEHGVYKLKSLEELKALIKSYYLEPYKYYNSSFVDNKYILKVCNSLYTDYFRFVDSTELNQDENIINFRNGLLYLDTMELKPHSSSIYSTIQISCNYNPNNVNAPIFNDYLDTLTNSNEDIKRVLLEVMGIAISNIKGYKMKKALFTIGKGDSGKSQLRLLTNELIGLENTSGIDLDTLEERFGTSAIYQKRVIGSADMGFMNVKQLRTFKQITGGDAINCEFKGGAFFSYIFDGVVWFSANEMPRFGGDKGDWVYNRMIIVKCDNVIPIEKQDTHLVKKMHLEGEAIVNMLIPHINDVIKNNYKYHVPEECIANREEYKKENSLVKLFLDECTEPRKVYDSCTTKKMYDVFKAWCGDNARGYTPTNQEFRKELVNIYGVNDIKELQKCVKGSYYYPFTLTLSAKQDYAKAYGYDSIYNEKEN